MRMFLKILKTCILLHNGMRMKKMDFSVMSLCEYQMSNIPRHRIIFLVFVNADVEEMAAGLDFTWTILLRIFDGEATLGLQ